MSVRIVKGAEMSPRERQEVVEWIRNVATGLEINGASYPKDYRVRFLSRTAVKRKRKGAKQG